MMPQQHSITDGNHKYYVIMKNTNPGHRCVAFALYKSRKSTFTAFTVYMNNQSSS
uniref:Uncharacterized protein n=1 Tax=Anguilla anguilla TaxID=7936 RepID=A0A0E9X0C8_ANGAN